MKRLLSHPFRCEWADVETVGDLLAMSASYGCVIALAVMVTAPAWSV